MGLFKKDKKEAEKKELPKLPELPELPSMNYEKDYDSSTQFPSIDEFPHLMEKESLPQLPSFPNNSLGDKFSQNTIKEAVSGKKESEMEDADEFEDEEPQMMQQPPEEPMLERIGGRSSMITPRVARAEPIFIRLDKFEESMELFSKLKQEIRDIQELLDETKKLKDEEEKELEKWQKEMQEMKKQIEKIDSDLFSKI